MTASLPLGHGEPTGERVWLGSQRAIDGYWVVLNSGLQQGAKFRMSDREGTDQLPNTREQIYDFIVQYKTRHNGNSPSLREIAEACTIVHSCVRHHLTQLEKENQIRILNNRSRTIEVVGSSWHPPQGHESAGEAGVGDDDSGGLHDTESDRTRYVG